MPGVLIEIARTRWRRVDFISPVHCAGVNVPQEGSDPFVVGIVVYTETRPGGHWTGRELIARGRFEELR